MINISNNHLKSREAKCSYCNKNFLIHRKYSGEYLCIDCFVKSIEKNIYKSISKYKMFRPKDKIIVGLSGGKDSIVLLYNLTKIQQKTHRSKPITAISVDEGIEKYRKNGLDFAKNFCEAHEIEHIIISFKEKIGFTLDKIIKKMRNSKDNQYACNYCALIRRRLLNDGAKELGGDVLAMGHNLTDIAETFLMNILYKRYQLISNQYLFKKETSIEPQFFIKKAMPLMRIPEDEILLYANCKKLKFYQYHCPYRESDPIIRKRVLNFLQESKKFSPEIEFNLFNGFLELSEILFNNLQKKKFNYCEKCGYPSGNDNLCSYCKFIEKLKV